jgi:predicted PolB exonuclease-like 3'-5' exonuclease
MTEFPWSDILRTAEGYNFKSHDTTTCGLHIHASRAIFGNSLLERDLNVAKCILMIDLFWNEYIVPFSRRDYSKLNQWARKPEAGISTADDDYTAIDKAKKSAYKGRYQAVNLQNHQTVEFRFFRGTLRRDTIIASLQFLDVLISYAKQTDLKDIFNKSFSEVFGNTGYPELTEYLKLRKLIKE